jgi:23S rRNA (uracil1939-C5)-methyltransferase
MVRIPSRPRAPLSSGAARIDDLAHDGRGVAHIDGKAVFIDGALPGETVRFHYTVRHSQHDEGVLEAVLEPAPGRVEPRCPHFGVCGGCVLQHLDGDRQIEYKERRLLDNLARIGKVQPADLLPPLRGPQWNYRRKARLGVKDVVKKGQVLVGFRERRSPYLADLRRCEVLAPPVGERLEELARLVERLTLRQQIPQIEVAIGESVTALSFRVLKEPGSGDREHLRAFGARYGIHIYLQPGGPTTTVRLWPDDPAPPLSYRLPACDLQFEFQPYHFTQINPAINRLLVDRALELLEVQPTDRVLDLFCGLGNFTLALARRSAGAVGVEGDAELVACAWRNAVANGIDNVEFVSADLYDTARLPARLLPPFDRILLDPPRSGALPLLPVLGSLAASRIVYVSCHPATLARDAGELVHRYGYRLQGAGVLDMFPHTAHVESIAVLVRV